MRICHIVGAGEFTGELIETGHEDYIIAADRGYKALTDLGIIPDLTVGDFDSLGYIPDVPSLIRHPVEKDDTDMMLAVRYGFDKGCDTFLLYGALGGRLDHTIANLQLLSYISKRGGKAFLIGRSITASAVTNGNIHFKSEASGIISVFSFGEKAEGVYLTGLRYPLTDATLLCDFPLGVSNEFTGVDSCVEVKKGTLTVLWYGPLDNAFFL